MIKKLAAIMVLVLAAAACDAVHQPPPAPGPATEAAQPLGPTRGVWEDAGIAENFESLDGLAVTAQDDAWAVGHTDRMSPLVQHWNGMHWRQLAPPGEESLRGVAASPGGAVWLFDAEGHAWQRKGESWMARGRLTGHAYAVSSAVLDTGEVWVAGRIGSNPEPGLIKPYVERWSQGHWTLVPSPVEVQLLSAASPREVWAVGTVGDRFLMAGRWDGTRWSLVPPPQWLNGRKGRWRWVQAVSSGEIWASGAVIDERGDYGEGFLLRWDGHGWRTLPPPAPDAFSMTVCDDVGCLGASAADGRGGIWLADEQARIWHYDGRQWAAEQLPSRRPTMVASALALVPGTRRAIAIGGRRSLEDSIEPWMWTRREEPPAATAGGSGGAQR
jgi:hypothetical protein